VLPNRTSFVWFEAPQEGVYQVVCTEYCGTGHSNMGAKIRVVSRTAFYAFLRNGFLPGEAPPSMAPAAAGAALYTQRNCNTCHSLDGTAGVGPSWLGVWGQPRPGSDAGVFDDAYVHQSTVAPQAYYAPGFAGGNMPSYEGQLDDAQIANIAAFMREINGAATVADTTIVPAGAPAPAP
jgi:cytochrome c oxidase subunit 2